MNDVPKQKRSEPFTKMAERIDKNEGESFGGAFVIVPPEGAGEPMQSLNFSSGTDLAQFWMMLQGMINAALQDIQAKQASPYGRPGR